MEFIIFCLKKSKVLFLCDSDYLIFVRIKGHKPFSLLIDHFASPDSLVRYTKVTDICKHSYVDFIVLGMSFIYNQCKERNPKFLARQTENSYCLFRGETSNIRKRNFSAFRAIFSAFLFGNDLEKFN